MEFEFPGFNRQTWTWPNIGIFNPETNQTMGAQSDAPPKPDLPLQKIEGEKRRPNDRGVINAVSTAATLALAQVAQMNAYAPDFPLAQGLSWGVPMALGAVGCYLAYKIWQGMGVSNHNTTKVEVHVHITSQNPSTVVVEKNGPIFSNVVHSGG